MNGRGQEISVANPVNETISYQTHYVCERREQEGEEEVGPGEGGGGLALEKEGESLGRCGTRAHGPGRQPGDQQTSWRNHTCAGLSLLPAKRGHRGKNSPLGANSWLSGREHPPCPVQLSEPSGAWKRSRIPLPPSSFDRTPI